MKKHIITFILFQILNLYSFGQDLILQGNIILYTNNISKAIAFNNDEKLDQACKHFKLANEIIPIHFWDLIYLRNFLKKRFDKELFVICIRSEIIQKGFSTTLNDSLLSNNLSTNELNEIKVKTYTFQNEYLRLRDPQIEKQLLQLESLDQFTRTCNISLLFNCDTCIQDRKRLIKYVDSAYTVPLIRKICDNPNLTYHSLGQSYTSFILYLRHVLNNNSGDTILDNYWKSAADRLVRDFIITPGYYANLTDYCFNFKLNSDNKKSPLNNYGEFNFNGMLQLDSPSEIDQRRASIGLLPLWEVFPKKLLPDEYIIWYESKNNQKKN